MLSKLPVCIKTARVRMSECARACLCARLSVRVTCQPHVDPVVLLPQPEDLLLSVLYVVHADRCRLLEVPAALPAAKEGSDVAAHHLQHRRRLSLQTCVTEAGPFRVTGGFYCSARAQRLFSGSAADEQSSDP